MKTKNRMPKGFREKGHAPKVAVMFPEDLFDKIKKMAVKENKTFSVMVVELCRVGVLDLEESDAQEPGMFAVSEALRTDPDAAP